MSDYEITRSPRRARFWRPGVEVTRLRAVTGFLKGSAATATEASPGEASAA